MPTPVGHAIGGLATAWFCTKRGREAFSREAAEKASRPLFGGVALACAVAATLADLDIVLSSHRTYTHSIGAVAIVGLLAWVASRSRRPDALRTAATIAAAYGSHLLLDWLGKDSATPAGLMALWPFSSRFYHSGLDLFQEVSRRYWNPDEFILGNLRTLGWELLMLGPVAGVAWWITTRKGQGARGEG